MKILCTLGPASLNKEVIRRMAHEGVSLFRLNLSHMKYEQLKPAVELIRSSSSVPVCFDSEGAQIRTAKMTGGKIHLQENKLINIFDDEREGNENEFSLYPENIVSKLEVGDLVSLDFNSALLKIISVKGRQAVGRVLNPGWIGSNKAVSVNRSVDMDPFTEKDLRAFELAKKLNIKHVALSFANRKSDVDKLRAMMGPDVEIISKIECKNALHNLIEIATASNAILIDRGDLSREIGVEFIPAWQKRIIKEAKKISRPVYVATNLLETMITQPVPTRAEVNDIFNTILDGANGLVLAAETAIGHYPIECVNIVNKMMKTARNFDVDLLDADSSTLEGALTLTSPHGGKLTEAWASLDMKNALNQFRVISVNEEILLDCYQLTSGGYSPLTSFMDKEELDLVLNEMKLKDGSVWTMPIILQKNLLGSDLKENETVRIEHAGKTAYVLKVGKIYDVDLMNVAKKWFGTTDEKHPGVKKLFHGGSTLISASVFAVEQPHFPFQEHIYLPRNLRYIFEKKGWVKIVGFHSRNVPHRAHEFIQKEALKISGADGLLVSPVLGPKKKGDFSSELILDSYLRLISRQIYPENKVFLAGFNSYSRFAGPREAVFTATCRQNFGCSHFIIGRDHAGVGDFYSKNAVPDLFEKISDGLLIKPVFFDECGYLKEKNDFGFNHPEALSISGSQVRETIMKGQKLPEWFMRTEIQELISEYGSQRKDIFI